MNRSPFHDGERQLQARMGVADRMEKAGRRIIRPFMLDQHRTFFAQLPFLVAGTVDPSGDVWTTLLVGGPGFAQSPDDTHLDLTLELDGMDPATAGLRDQDAIGLLGIELSTRRRNRMNGHLTRTAHGLNITVEHSFGNCPKYIQRSELRLVPPATSNPTALSFDRITPDVRRRVERAHTFYVSSYVDLDTGRQVDASHRGGRPGFVHIDKQGTLTIPDFSGNNAFNTLGNFMKNQRAGLLFVDFETGDVVQMTGRVEVLFDDPAIDAFRGAKRLWKFYPRRFVVRDAAVRIRATDLDPAPEHARTGTWDDVR